MDGRAGCAESQAESILSPGSAERSAGAMGEGRMKRILGLACAAFALGLFGSPLAAQETAPATPAAEQLPPPPPFPPMPSSRPSHRYVDVRSHHSSRSHASTRSARKERPIKHADPIQKAGSIGIK